jgi:putative FmdB family regulatory protein
MPIYAYKCGSCGHSKDVLQKVSDAPLTECPACGAPAFSKQITAAGFQLKGSGWYATDFRGGNTAAPAADKPAETAKPEGGSSAGTATPSKPDMPSASAGGCGASCACH